MRDQNKTPPAFRRTALFTLVAGAAQTAQAQLPAATPDPAAAESLFQDGRRLIRSGDFHVACARFEESFRLDRAAGTLANLADCEERLGRIAGAWQHWLQAADLMDENDPRRGEALGRAAQLEKLVPTLQITLEAGAPAASRVARDGVALAEESLQVPLPTDPGHHVILISAPARETRRIDLILLEGEKRVLVVAPGEPLPPAPWRAPTSSRTPGAGRASPTPVALPATRAIAPDDSGPPSLLVLARRLGPRDWVVAGAGAASLGAAIYFGVQALAARDDAAGTCSRVRGLTRCWTSADRPLDRDRRWSLLSDAALVAGLGAVATGVYLWTRSRTFDEPAATGLLAAPVRGGAEVQVAGRF
jgi:hypothetical protein